MPGVLDRTVAVFNVAGGRQSGGVSHVEVAVLEDNVGKSAIVARFLYSGENKENNNEEQQQRKYDEYV